MGTPKYALRFNGETFAGRAVAALRKITAGRISFVTGASQDDENMQLLPVDIARIADVMPGKAALGGIYTALTHSKSEWSAILACDYPFVTAELFARMAEIAFSAQKNVAVVAPVQPDGRIQSLCALYRKELCLEALSILLNDSRVPAVRLLLEKVTTRRVDFNEIADLDEAERFFVNVNTPEDFQSILA